MPKKKKNIKFLLQIRDIIVNLIKKGHKKRFNFITYKHDRELDAKMWASLLILSTLLTILIFLAGYNKNYFLYSLLLPRYIEKEVRLECITYRKLDGVCVTEKMIADFKEIIEHDDGNKFGTEKEGEGTGDKDYKEFVYQERPYFAVMVENHIVSQPLSGVQEAAVVFETLVEGPITRFMLLYPYSADVKKIGPVRSARPYFVDWVKGFDALYAHVGGSPQALQEIKNQYIFDFDEFSKTSYFWRAQNRDAPHNVYTSTTHLRHGFQNTYMNNSINPYEPWKFKDPADEDTRGIPDKDIIVNFSVEPYNVTWEYNRNENVYYRFVQREPYLDDNNYYIYSENVVILEADFETIDNVGRRQIDTSGPHKGIVLRDGGVYDITWQKNPITHNIELLNEYNKKFILNRGKVWVQVVPSLNSVIY